MDTLPFGGLHKTGGYAVGLDSFFRACSAAHRAEDDQFAQRLLGMVVRRRHPRDAKKSEEVFVLGADEVRSQRLGRLKTKGLFADALEFSEEAFFDPQ